MTHAAPFQLSILSSPHTAGTAVDQPGADESCVQSAFITTTKYAGGGGDGGSAYSGGGSGITVTGVSTGTGSGTQGGGGSTGSAGNPRYATFTGSGISGS